jgi:hypothetical protein
MSRWLLALLVLTTLSVGTIVTSGAAGTRDDSGNQLAGTWEVTVNRPAPLPPVLSLQAYTQAGSVIESGNDGSASRSPSYGVWERIGGRLYAASVKFFRFDPQTGAYLGVMKIQRTIQLSEDAQSWTAAGRATQYDVNGNVLLIVPVTATAERMPLEPLP